MANILFGILQWAGLVASFWGYFYCVKKISNASNFFIPISVFSAIAVFVYFGGLLNSLFPVSCIIYLLGFICFAIYIKDLWQHQISLKVKPTLFSICFTICTCIFIGFLFHANFEHYDNFSHWALIVKQLISADAFPDASTKIIEFQNYPLGTASFIYYICRFTSHSEGVMLASQGCLIFACFLAMFGTIKEKKRFLLYSILGAGCSILIVFNISIRINNLLVDFVLPMMSLAGISISYLYQKKRKTQWFLLIPVLGLLTIVKSTGVIFASIVVLYTLSVDYHKGYVIHVRKFISTCVRILLVYLPIILWQIRMKTVFAGVTNKFELSAAGAENGLNGKTMDDIKNIIQMFLTNMVNVNNRSVIGFILFQVFAMVMIFIVYHYLHKSWKLKKRLIQLDIILALYYIGILAMYIFAMPLDEAITLAGVERYASSIILFFGGSILLCTTIDIENSFAYKIGEVETYKAYKSAHTKKLYQRGIIATCILCVTFLLSEFNGLHYVQNQYSTSFPARLSAITTDRWIQGGQVDTNRYLLYASDKENQMTNYYVQYVTKYFLYAQTVDGVCSFYEDNLLNLLSQYDYLIIAETDYHEKYLMKKYFHINGDLGIYSTKELLAEQTD